MEINCVLNDGMVIKLESMALDIKHYINVNSAIGNSVGEDGSSNLKFMGVDDMNELIEIRDRIKLLSYKLKNK